MKTVKNGIFKKRFNFYVKIRHKNMDYKKVYKLSQKQTVFL